MNTPRNLMVDVNLVMSWLCALVLTSNLILVTGTTPAMAQADNFDIPVDETVFSLCAGEYIHFTRAYHVPANTAVDANGTDHIHVTYNDYNVIGLGLSSGTKYHRVGVTNFMQSFSFKRTRGQRQGRSSVLCHHGKSVEHGAQCRRVRRGKAEMAVRGLGHEPAGRSNSSLQRTGGTGECQLLDSQRS